MTTGRPRVFILRFKDLIKWQVPRAALGSEGLPDGWSIVRMADVARQYTERVRVEPATEYRMLGVKWYSEGVFLRETVRGEAMSASWVTPAKPGAFIYNRLFAWKESFAVLPGEFADCFVSGEFPQFLLDSSRISADYLRLLFRLPSVIGAVNAASVGSAAVSRNRFKEAEFLRMELPVPPIAVQERILAAWRKAQGEIAAAEERIAGIERQIHDGFLSDLGLQAPTQELAPKCFVGRWRDLYRWSVSFNQAAMSTFDLTKGLFPVVQLGSLLTMVQYGTSEKANGQARGAPVLRMSNIKDGAFDLCELKHVELSDADRARLLLSDGDILVNRTNSKELVGKCAVFHESGEYVFASYLIRLRLRQDEADSDFVSFVLNSPMVRRQIGALSRQIIGQANINSQELRSLQIPLPPGDVQRRIMERVEAGRARIARERSEMRRIAEASESDLNDWLLGIKEAPQHG